MSVYEMLQLEPFEPDKYDVSNAEEKKDMEQEARSVYPEVHKTNEEKLAVFRDADNNTTYTVVGADDEESKTMKDYFHHETAHLFGEEVDTEKANDDVSRRAAKRAALIENADDAMRRYAQRDNLTGKDMLPGTISCVDVIGSIVVMSDENIDLELTDILRDEDKENIAKAVRAGCPIRSIYFLQIGEVQEKNTELFEAFRDSNDILTLVSSAIAVRDALPRRHAARFTKALTESLNSLVRVSLGTGLYVGNFFDDIEDLIDLISERYGSASPVSKMFLSKVPELIASRCGNLVPVSQDDNDKGPRVYQHLLPCVWQQIPVRASALNFSIGEARPYGFVSRSRFPELYNLVDSLLSEDPRLDKETDFFDVKIETTDGFGIRCHRSLLGDKLLISKV